MNTHLSGSLLVLSLFAPLCHPAPVAAPVSLKCEYLTNPMGIDVRAPRFSWVPVASARGARQGAYQILVSARPGAAAGDVWDTGRVAAPEFSGIAYAGPALHSARTYYWRVRSWDGDGNASAYSAPARFDTGLFERTEWSGKWISGGGELRKEFTLPSRPVRARAFMAGLGYSELYINGLKVGDHVLDPAWTTFAKRVLYVTHDITPLLHQGANAAGVMLGEGWFKSRALLLEIRVEMENGAKATIASDGTWKVTGGPIVSDSVYDGEAYDATRETPGWDAPGFDDAGWKVAATIEGPKGTLSAQMMPPIRVVDALAPIHMTSPRPGVFVYDLGQNTSGWVRLRVQGPRGTTVRLRHSELLYEDGSINIENMRKAKVTDTYVLKGSGSVEVYEPRFTYHGFRYVELSGFPGTPTLDTIRGRVVHSALDPTGGFTSSKKMLNDLQHNIVWGIKTNLHSVPTDCNQRDERRGWMADAHLYAETAMLNFDAAAFYTNFLRDIADTQNPDGTITDTAPFAGGRRPADPAWGAAYPLIAWYMYENYGDRRILEQHYAGVKAWTGYLDGRAKDGILEYYYYGDWVPVDRTPGNLVSTVYYYLSTDLTARMAQALGNTADAALYRSRADAIRTAFHTRFYNATTATYGNGSQTASVLPAALGMVPQDAIRRVLGALESDVVYHRDNHLTTGILGTQYVLPLLARNSPDVAYELATQTTYPSWGYMIEHGATTIWELWQERTGPSMNSHNHPMFGSIGSYLYRNLAGIRPDAAGPGWRRVVIQPDVVRDLRWASGTFESIRGTVSSSWQRSPEGTVKLETTIPVGSEAEIHIPKLNTAAVLEESGQQIWKQGAPVPAALPQGIRQVRNEKEDIVVTAGSGVYRFETRP
jgi:alpha-L-rhamnosidase